MKKLGVVSLIARVYLLAISIFFIFRVLLLSTEISRLDFTSGTYLNMFKAFVMGVRFDIVITGYIVVIPALVLFIQEILNRKSEIIYTILFYWIFILFSVAFVISAADISYFNQFFSRFSIGAFEWMDSPKFVFNMIIQEPKYFMVVVPWIILVFVFYRFLKKIFRLEYSKPKMHFGFRILASCIFLFIMLVGIRGRLAEKSPIRVGTAYFCQDPLLNQLGLNPVYTLIQSFLDSLNEKNKSINLIDDQVAIENVQKYLGITEYEISSPLSREIVPETSSTSKPNVVLVIMESMSTAKMERHGNKNNLTPFLDSLSNEAYYFENIYTAGQHTFNGIFSTLYSFPALYRQHPMKTIKNYTGISSSLKEHGYSTSYFCTHDGQFDNVQGFLMANDFENVISQSDYPFEEVKTTLGVPDDYMFRYSMPIIDELYDEDKPFFVTYMTASDHGPFYVPEYFTPRSSEIKKQIVEYADWSLEQLIEISSEKEWFENTIFVFIADHGAALDVHYDIPLKYHHSPLVIYSPKMNDPKLFSNIGGQIDVYPTIMGMLNLPYMNNTLGIDLINEERPYIFINGDDKIAALDNEFLLILKEDNNKGLYKYKELDSNNYIEQYPEKAAEMEEYMHSNMQVFQHRLLSSK